MGLNELDLLHLTLVPRIMEDKLGMATLSAFLQHTCFLSIISQNNDREGETSPLFIISDKTTFHAV